MFLAYALEERRPGPAPLTLILTCPAPALTRLKIIDPLPANLLSEHGAQFLQAMMDRADPVRPRPLRFVMGEAQAIVVFHSLTRPLGSIFGVGIIISEARRPIGIDVLGWLAFDDPFC